MCFGMLDPSVQNDFKTINSRSPEEKADISRRLVLGGLFGDFAGKLKNAQPDASVKPKSLGTVILDPTRQA